MLLCFCIATKIMPNIFLEQSSKIIFGRTFFEVKKRILRAVFSLGLWGEEGDMSYREKGERG